MVKQYYLLICFSNKSYCQSFQDNVVFSACRNEKSSFFVLFSIFSIENEYFGFFALYPTNNATTLFNLDSLNPSNISSCFEIAKRLRITLAIIGVIDNSAPFVSVVNGVISFPVKVA